MKKTLLLFAIILSIHFSFAQNINVLFDMMDNNDINYYEVQQYAKDYFATVGTQRGTGYKQYKRWEYEMQYWIDAKGNRINPHDVAQAAVDFENENGGMHTLGFAPWIDLGPDYWNRTTSWNPGVGRIDAFAVNPNDRNEIYIASPEGGVWKTTDGGTNWHSITDGLTYMKIGAVAIDPSNNLNVFIGTAGYGLLKSNDGGNTVTPVTSLNQSANIKKIIVDPTNSNKIFLATATGVYRSFDAGVTWTKSTGYSVTDIEFKPNNTSVIYACGNNFYKSIDGGITFTQVTNGITRSDAMRIAVSANTPNRVCIVQCNGSVFGAFYRSDDSATTFITTVTGNSSAGTNFFGYSVSGNDTRGQGSYNIGVCMSPNDGDLIHIAGVITWVSYDGGYNWDATTEWSYPNGTGYTHSDIHALEYVGNTLYVGSDGGIYFSDNDGDSFSDLSKGLSIRMVYRLGLSATDPVRVACGAQDNGCSVLRSTGWLDWLGADGMECAIDPTNSNIMFGTSQNGSFYRSMDGGNTYTSISEPDTGNWITPFVIDHNNTSIVFVGFKQIFKTTDRGGTWFPVSNFSGSTAFDNLEIASSNSKVLYASRGSSIYRTTDGGANWVSISAGLNGYTVNRIALHGSSPLKVAVALSSSQIFTSVDGGTTWVNSTADFPAVTARCLVYDNGVKEGIYVGTNTGVYYRDNTMSGWVDYSIGLPKVAVNELEIQYAVNKIRIATYGRGIWENDLYDVNTEVSTISQQRHHLTLFPNPSNGKFYFKTGNLKNGVYAVTCKSMTGQTIFEGKQFISNSNVNELDFSAFSSGIYYLSIGDADTQLYSKVVVN